MNKFNAHILVVDDDDGIRELVKKYLSENNFLITTANSAEDAKEKFICLSPGKCTRTPKNTSHVFLAITDCTLIVLLTKKWDDCEKPIVHENLGMGKGDHGDPESEYHKD